MSNLQNNIASLEALITKANALPEEKTIQSSKTVTPTTSSQTVKPDSGYDGLGQVVVNAMPTATQATPSVSIDSAGKITATATQSAGYVAAGTKTGTKQLTTQAAKTITPTKSSQTAVAKNVYTTGAVTVAAIPSQYITTTDASAAADDIVTGETAYVNGVKVTGTNPYEKVATDSEVAAQATQIEEIMGLLDGKSVPGGGSSGGGSVKTCSLSITCNDKSKLETLMATVYRDGEIKTIIPFVGAGVTTFTLDNVVCETGVYASFSGLQMYGYTFGGGAKRTFPESGFLGATTVYIQMPSEAGANATVTVYDND